MVQVTLRAPHSFLYVEVEDADGSTKQWVIEGATAAQFARQGIDKDAFKIGDPVEVVANPSRSPNSTHASLDQDHANHRRQVVGQQDRARPSTEMRIRSHESTVARRCDRRGSRVSAGASPACGPRWCRRRVAAGWSASDREGDRADRPHRLLDGGDHRRLARAHADAGERRLRQRRRGHDRESWRRLRRRRSEPVRAGQHPVQSRGRSGSDEMGSRKGRGRRKCLQGVRRGRDHAAADAPAYHLAGREHVEGRSRLRDTDAPFSFRSTGRRGTTRLQQRHVLSTAAGEGRTASRRRAEPPGLFDCVVDDHGRQRRLRARRKLESSSRRA